MMSDFIEKVTGRIGEKKRWREHRERGEALPAGYRTAVEALEPDLLYPGAITKGDLLADLHVEQRLIDAIACADSENGSRS